MTFHFYQLRLWCLQAGLVWHTAARDSYRARLRDRNKTIDRLNARHEEIALKAWRQEVAR